jgi:hypothetical protein
MLTMLNKLTSQLWDKCINEIKKEETLVHIEQEILAPLFRRYYARMQRIMLQIYTMYFIILLLLVVVLLLLAREKYLG